MEKYNYKNTTIRFLSVGEGSQAIIMLHNGAAYHGIWKHQINEFKTTHHIYALDLINFGESDYISNSSSIHQNYLILKNFIEHYNIENPILMGTCIGASLALYYANKHPTKVKKCILFNICPGIKLLRTPLIKYWYQLTKKSRYIKKINNWGISKVMNSEFEYNRLPDLLFGYHKSNLSDIYKKLQNYYRTDKQKKARLDLLNEIDTYTISHFITEGSELPEIQMFWGEYNKIVPLEIGHELRSLLKPKEFHSLKLVGHLMMLESPIEINKKIRQFLK